jgi:hypothetical protein
LTAPDLLDLLPGILKCHTLGGKELVIQLKSGVEIAIFVACDGRLGMELRRCKKSKST